MKRLTSRVVAPAALSTPLAWSAICHATTPSSVPTADQLLRSSNGVCYSSSSMSLRAIAAQARYTHSGQGHAQHFSHTSHKVPAVPAYSNRHHHQTKSDKRAHTAHEKQQQGSEFLSRFKQVSRSVVMSVNLARIVTIFGEPNVQRSRNTTGVGFIAALKVRDPTGAVTTCVGFDAKRKAARTLSLYHAHLVMNAFEERKAIQDSQKDRPTTGIGASLGVAPPAPPPPTIPPLIFSDSVAKMSKDLPTLPPNHTAEQRAKQMVAYEQMRLPEIGDPVFDRCARLVSQYENDDPKGIKQLWKQTSRRKPISVRHGGVWISSMKVPGYTNHPAVGVAESSKFAEHRCILHALLIMRMAKEGTVDLSGLSPQDAAVMSFYLKSSELKTSVEPAPIADPELSKRYHAVKVTIGDFSATAEAINEIEAQKKAVVSIVKEMMRHDDHLKKLSEFSYNSGIELNGNIPTLLFPERIVERAVEEYDSLETTEVKALLAPKHNSTRRVAATEALEQLSKEMAVARARVLQSEAYRQSIDPVRSGLSIADHREALMETIENNQVTILCGTTGCGKSTQVPQYVFDDMIAKGRGAETNIIVTQPRRISAISIAERVASERLQQIRDHVGYSIRLDNSAGRHITFMTTGILLSLLVSDPTAAHITHLIIDEIHERDVNTDVILSLVKKLAETRKDLRIILMSATMQSKLFAAYFENAPILNVEGRMFPVKTFFLEDLQEVVRRSPSANRDLSVLGRYIQDVEQATNSRPMDLDCRIPAMAVRHALATEPVGKDNSILVFLPGWSDIVKTERELNGDAPGRYHIIKLHSSVSMAGQRACFAPTPAGKTKVILATNIAESGITIDGVTVVIDAAMSFLTYYTRRNANSAFVTEMRKIICSKASTTQRMGRAGRTQKGRYFCLLSKEVYDETPHFHTAEILRVSLDNVILRLLGMGFSNAPSLLESFIEPPPHSHVVQAMDDLKELGALDEQGKLTLLGYHLAKVPTEPRQSKILITSMMLGCLEAGMTAVATTEIDPFTTNRDLKKEVRSSKQLFAMGTNSDHLARVNAVHSWLINNSLTRSHHLDESSCRKLLQYKEQYRKVLRDSLHIREDEAISPEAFSTVCLRAAVASGYFPKVALSNRDTSAANGSASQKKASEKTFSTKTERSISLGKGSAIDPKSPNLPSPFYVVYDTIFVPPGVGPVFSNATFVTMMELVLIATPMTRIKYFEEFNLAVIDGWVPFLIRKEQFDVLSKLKALIDVRVWQKLEQPTDSRVEEQFAHSMQIVKDVLYLSARADSSEEEEGAKGGADDDDDDDDDGEDSEEDASSVSGSSSGAGNSALLTQFSKSVVDFTRDNAEVIVQRLNAAAAARDDI